MFIAKKCSQNVVENMVFYKLYDICPLLQLYDISSGYCEATASSN